MPRRLPQGWGGSWLVGVGVVLLVAVVDRVERDAGQVLLVVTAAGGVLGGLRPLWWWRWGLLVGLVVPATEELAWLRGWTAPVPADPGRSSRSAPRCSAPTWGCWLAGCAPADRTSGPPSEVTGRGDSHGRVTTMTISTAT